LILAPVGEREVDFSDRRQGLISGNSNARSPATPVVVDAVDEADRRAGVGERHRDDLG
jgi:hypothetical protein